MSLSRVEDRPVAIDGLQQRLLRAMNVQGGFGVFDEPGSPELLCRSLLWCRGADTPALSRIAFPISQGVPCWSWMAYHGGIDYLEIQFGQCDWETVVAPWASDHETRNDSVLHAVVHSWELEKAKSEETFLTFDNPEEFSSIGTRCVVLGKQRGMMSPMDQRCYVLLVVQTLSEKVVPAFERVGVGYLPRRCIGSDADAIRASVY